MNQSWNIDTHKLENIFKFLWSMIKLYLSVDSWDFFQYKNPPTAAPAKSPPSISIFHLQHPLKQQASSFFSTNSPISKSFIKFLALSEWPTESKFFVASVPEFFSKGASVPGCLSNFDTYFHYLVKCQN